MPAGIEIYNTGGIIQISSNTPNWCFIQKITLASNFPNQEITITANSPLIFIKTENNILVFPSYKSGTTHKFKIFRAYYTNNQPATLYVFDRIASPTHNVGFEVYGSDGSSCYSADNKPLKISQVFQIPDLGGDAGHHNHDFALPSGNWAAMCAVPRYETRYMDDNIENYEYLLGDCLKVTSNNININCIQLYPTAESLGSVNPYGGQLLVADVTGL
jgi:hypothetical protein